MMGAARHFSTDYRQAREQFLAAVEEQGAKAESFVNPAARGALGEVLSTDVVWLGPVVASNLLILISGTHGVEGFCGSGCQIAALREGAFAQAGSNTAVLLIHAINPYGFSWLRRTNEDNIDLNRNSVDHAHPPASHPAYTGLHPLLLPATWEGDARAIAERALGQFIQEHGEKALHAAISLGQYTHPDGLFYGGSELAWSTRLFQDLLRRFAQDRRRVAMIDYHTGLGPSGYGEPIYSDVDAQGLSRARSWYGAEVTSVHESGSISALVQGPLMNGARWVLPEIELTSIALEFGTVAPREVMEAMRAEQWLTLHGQPDSELARQIKARMRDAFYVDSEQWKAAVLERSSEMIGRALHALAQNLS
jgi:hypothetical protein